MRNAEANFNFVLKQEHLENLAKLGRQFEGKNADFAEYMEVDNLTEKERMIPGTVVNFANGKITIQGFDSKTCHPMVVTTQPLILGNSTEDNSKKVPIAMVGQVPVNLKPGVRANAGDRIIVGGFPLCSI